MDELTSMFQAVENLAAAFVAKTSGGQTPDAALAAARASAQAALTSATNASTQAANATASATAANTSKTNAAASATAAATSATNAGNSATSAAGSATAAGTSASAASTSATNASNSNTAAQGYNNRVQSLQQVSPAAAAASTTGAANTTWSANCSFTAPCNGWVFAIGSYNQYQPGSSGYQCTLFINGNSMSTDTTVESQKHLGTLYVSAGTVVSISMQASSQSTAPLQGGTLHVVAFFIPAAA